MEALMWYVRILALVMMTLVPASSVLAAVFQETFSSPLSGWSADKFPADNVTTSNVSGNDWLAITTGNGGSKSARPPAQQGTEFNWQGVTKPVIGITPTTNSMYQWNGSFYLPENIGTNTQNQQIFRTRLKLTYENSVGAETFVIAEIYNSARYAPPEHIPYRLDDPERQMMIAGYVGTDESEYVVQPTWKVSYDTAPWNLIAGKVDLKVIHLPANFAGYRTINLGFVDSANTTKQMTLGAMSGDNTLKSVSVYGWNPIGSDYEYMYSPYTFENITAGSNTYLWDNITVPEPGALVLCGVTSFVLRRRR